MTARRHAVAAMLAVLALLGAGCGGGDDGSPTVQQETPADQTVDVTMVDLAFEPDVITVRAGATVRFRFRNEGLLVHDATFGDEATQEAVAEGSRRREGVEVAPNGSKSYVRTFSQPGTLVIGCHQPGHYRQGMKARLIVA